MIDILVGWIYAAATFYFGSKLLDRWEARRTRQRLDKSTNRLELESLQPDATLVNSS